MEERRGEEEERKRWGVEEMMRGIGEKMKGQGERKMQVVEIPAGGRGFPLVDYKAR